MTLGHAVLRRFEASTLPVVAACQGLCLAGGLELMLACDVVFAARDARFGDQHAQFGLVPGWGGSQRLPRLVGLRRALDLFYSARWIDAETALQWGLVNHVVAPEALAAEALAYCKAIGARSRGGLATMKRLARVGLEGTLDAGLSIEESQAPGAILERRRRRRPRSLHRAAQAELRGMTRLAAVRGACAAGARSSRDRGARRCGDA